jgi:hypothetical protein
MKIKIVMNNTLFPLNLYIASAYAVIAEKYAQSRVDGIATFKLFHIPKNRLKYLNTVSQLSFKCVLGTSVNDFMISAPLRVAFTIISRNGSIQMTPSRISNMYKIVFLTLYPTPFIMFLLICF